MKKLLALALLLAACGGSDWTGTGRVYEKDYDDPDTVWVPAIHIPGSCSGNPPVCTPGINTPGYSRHESERFILKVIDDEGKKHNLSVAQSVWDNCYVNQNYSTEDERCIPQ